MPILPTSKKFSMQCRQAKSRQRLDWAAEYDGQPFVVYGHTVAERPEIINRTVDIDQGCVYGGYLTALRYPEIEFVQVRGKKYAEYHGGGKVPEE